MSVLIALTALTLMVLVWPYLRFVARVIRLTRSIPGPPSYPIIGSFLQLKAKAGKPANLAAKIDHIVERYGSIFKMWLGPLFLICVLDPADLEVVYTSPHLSQKSGVYRFITPIIGNGLLSMNGARYKRHRKAITTSLHMEILQDFVPTFNSNTRKLAHRLGEHADSGQLFNITPLIGVCANVNVCETVLSTDVAGLEATLKDAHVSALTDANRLVISRVFRPWYIISDTIFSLSSQHRGYQKLKSSISNYVAMVLERKLEQRKAEAGSKSQRRRQAFLDHMLETDEGAELTKDEVFEHLKTLVSLASLSTMDFMSLFMITMSLQPEVQRRVHMELDEIFGTDSDRDVLSSDLPHMRYLEQVLKEVMRYFNPVPFIGRQATRDVSLPSGHVIPQGAHVVVMAKYTHRNARWFPNPHKFEPDRFLPENSRGRHPFAFVPFSAGSRNCVGQRYAYMFAKTMASSILRKYTVLPNPDGAKTLEEVHLVLSMSLSVRGGAKIRLEHRKPSAA